MAAKKKKKKKKAAARKTVKKKVSRVKKKVAKRSAKKAVRKKAAKKKAAKRTTKRVATKKSSTKKSKKKTKKKAARKTSASSRAKRATSDDANETRSSESAIPSVPRRRRAAVSTSEAAGGAPKRVPRRTSRARSVVSEAPSTPVPPRRTRTIPSRTIPKLADPSDAPPAQRSTGRSYTSRRPTRRRPPPGTTPTDLLEAVRQGEYHIASMSSLDRDALLALANDEGLEVSDDATDREIIGQLLGDLVSRSRSRARTRTPSRVTTRKESIEVEGLLELHPDGYGFLRKAERNYTQHPEDVYVGAALVRNEGIKPGHWIRGQAHRKKPGLAYLALDTVTEVNHEDPAKAKTLTDFHSLTVVYPDTRIVLETEPEEIETRVMDIFCPLGRGQRGLIVAPPRTGKTVMLTKLADAIATNSPDVDIVVLLVDERPEEVTNMRRSVRGEVIASTFDKPATNHIRVAELVIDKIKRMVEYGRHVVLLLDSITRLGRAYNNQTSGSGRILTGGLDADALTKPKRFFGSARNVEGGGSLTIVATALVDTGSKLDQVIFEEFKGTGNMELVLNRDLSNARVWPAIDVPASGTRNEDLLLHPDELDRVVKLRRAITGQEPLQVMVSLRKQLAKHTTNAQFLLALNGEM